MSIEYDTDDLDELYPDWGDIEEKQRFYDECIVSSMRESEYRLYLNNKIDTVILLLKSIIDVLKQGRNNSK